MATSVSAEASGSGPDSIVVDTFVGLVEILFQDNDIVLINKPCDLQSLSGENQSNKDSVHFRMVQQLPTILRALNGQAACSGVHQALSREETQTEGQSGEERGGTPMATEISWLHRL